MMMPAADAMPPEARWRCHDAAADGYADIIIAAVIVDAYVAVTPQCPFCRH